VDEQAGLRGTGSLEGRAVLVTGGNSGIGLSMAAACAAAGARVVVWGRDEAKNEVAVERLRSKGAEAHAFGCDVGDQDQVRDTFERSVEAVGGRIHSVFANAGRTGTGTPFVDVGLDEWHDIMRTNIDGVMLAPVTVFWNMTKK
jgi:NAD(P)-dependent dehydrogenase (short-subunit alcohol dehydrogenase family)